MSSSVPTLNQGQDQAALAILQFLFSDDKEFILSGPAGTGKTFMMHHVMGSILKDYENGCVLLGKKPTYYDIEMTATTNKATEVLSQATGFPASTIHSFMNLKVKDNYKTGVSDIIRTNSWQVYSRRLIFIDEASMIDSKLHKFILEGTDATCKIVYLGDHCQLAPVFEKLSPVYRTPKHFALLTEPMRNAEQPALMDLCNQLRETVETMVFKPITPVPGVIDYLDDAEAQKFIDRTFNTESGECRILCYTNTRVQEYNAYVRLLRQYPVMFSVGENLVSNTSFEYGKHRLRVEQDVLVTEVDTSIIKDQIDPNDPAAILEVYRVIIKAGALELSVKIPADPEHHKALAQYYARQKNWPVFYKLKNTYPDLRQRDAATVYKAQGSTYTSVFLDLSNIGKCTDNDQLARMLYVGASRATTRLYLYGQLPKRLFTAPAQLTADSIMAIT